MNLFRSACTMEPAETIDVKNLGLKFKKINVEEHKNHLFASHTH